MIGNDVVDLQLACVESNWRRRGFLQKIFTENEQAFLAGCKTPEIWVWNLWSRKEAVYKIVNRELGIRAFIPHLLECVPQSENNGTVRFRNVEYFTRTTNDLSCLHTIAVKKPQDFDRIRVVTVPEIDRSNFLPQYLNNAASVSHHGRFEKCVGFISPIAT